MKFGNCKALIWNHVLLSQHASNFCSRTKNKGHEVTSRHCVQQGTHTYKASQYHKYIRRHFVFHTLGELCPQCSWKGGRQSMTFLSPFYRREATGTKRYKRCIPCDLRISRCWGNRGWFSRLRFMTLHEEFLPQAPNTIRFNFTTSNLYLTSYNISYQTELIHWNLSHTWIYLKCSYWISPSQINKETRVENRNKTGFVEVNKIVFLPLLTTSPLTIQSTFLKLGKSSACF